MTNLSQQAVLPSGLGVVAGAYFQPSAGVAIAGVEPYRDGQITVQAGTATTAGPAAAAVIVTITPGTAGLWEVTGTVSVTGASVIAVESNNVGLYQTSTARLALIPMPCSTAGSPAINIPKVILNLSATDTVNMKVLATSTGTAIYAGSLVATLVG
jgi:hypothetical protein